MVEERGAVVIPMVEQEHGINWQELGAALAAPFPPAEVEWRPAGKASPGARTQLVAYIGAAAVMQRLDDAVGVGAWSFTWEPLVVDGGEVRVAKGTLTVLGIVKEDLGTASNWEPSKGCISDALKRAGVLWGIGRYLRDIPQVSCTLDDRGAIPQEMRAKLAEALRRRQSSAA